MRIGFLNNQIDNRGTGNALYDYAHYNEEILSNQSLVFTWDHTPADPLMKDKLIKRFGKVRYLPDLFGNGYKDYKLDALYHIKYGRSIDAITIPGAAYLVHAVFDVSQPHGDVYAAVSKWLAGSSLPFVPHILEKSAFLNDLRGELDIPKDALVFGRHGGYDSFDVPFVWDAIVESLNHRDDIYFLFLNTAPYRKDPRIIHLDSTANFARKEAFINSCDAMLHARQRGETFGIAVGEFAIRNKPVITYGLSPEQAHYNALSQPVYYFGPDGLTDILVNWERIASARVEDDRYNPDKYPYRYCNPEDVMTKFEEVFLDETTWGTNRTS